MDMTGMLVESVVLAFTLGGIVGAAAALCLKSSRAWDRRESPEERFPEKPVPVRSRRR